ncbi:ubiquitin-associated domain-containing protein 1 isoform X2 [Frankliniella occidentalis]|uniref:Ubiquitin-associated domain-containing protein 1 isoform X2 n=1 Tax=Frankliniella occidentalis TaxID=133901 RepID=A0A9C6U6L1_FRAOC|nr:ubiquitin-associated domain-containing protein 1 isoform X2 [Frankliniella occidentalis]
MSSSESDHLKIVVINSGAVWRAKISTSAKISKLTALAVSHFHGSGLQSSSKLSRFRMVLVRTRAVLSWDMTVSEEELKDNVECRIPPKRSAPDLRGPTSFEINEATKHLAMQNSERSGQKSSEAEDDLDYAERFSKDSPRIFISLIETGAQLLNFTPNGMEVLQQVKKEWNSKKDIPIHSPYVKQLTDMGFSERLVVKALTDKKMNVNEAMEWLLEQSSNSKEADQAEEPSSSQAKPMTVLEEFQNLMQAALSRRQENIKLDLKLVERLKQMGFKATDIERALRETDNNIKEAVALLKDSPNASAATQSKHLDPHGSMFKAMMASEIIQLNLEKPKFLLALLSILEDPQSLTLWLKDREICCILNYLILLHNTEVSGGRKLT